MIIESTPEYPSIRSRGAVVVLLLTAALMTACSAAIREVHDEPPQVTIDGLERRDNSVVVDLALRNVNDEPLRLESASLTLSLDGEALANGTRNQPLTITTRGREVLRLSMPARSEGLARLDSLADGERQQLPWSMDAQLVLAGQRDRTVRAEGWLHRVPGHPDRFR